MPAVKHPVPAQLAKRGITGVSDNRAGRDIKLPAGTLMNLFGDELRSRFQESEGRVRPPARPSGG